MINTVRIINHRGESVKMEMRRPDNSGLHCVHIDGLGPVMSTINMTQTALGDGAVYNSAKALTRNIVMLFLLGDDPSVEVTRHLLYRVLPLKQKVTIEIDTDTRYCVATGYVESNQLSPFSRRSMAQVSIICPSAYLQSGSPRLVMLNGTQPAFTFPFSNEDPILPKIIFGEIYSDNEKAIEYYGDVHTGVVLHIHANGSAVDPRVYRSDTKETIQILSDRLVASTGSGIIAGDDILISTVPGDKYATLLRSGVITNILNCLGPDPDWFGLDPGENILGITATDGLDNLQMRVSYHLSYEGV